MEIYLVRHAETDWNGIWRVQGTSDTPLNSKGRELAGKTGEALEDVSFDVIYTSPLARAYETACLIRGHRNIPVIRDDRLQEMGFGVNEGKLSKDLVADPNQKYRYLFEQPELYEPMEGGETIEEVCARAADFMINEIEPEKNNRERVMIVGHGALNQGLLSYIRKNDISHFWDGSLQRNCGIMVISLDDDGYQILDEDFAPYNKNDGDDLTGRRDA